MTLMDVKVSTIESIKMKFPLQQGAATIYSVTVRGGNFHVLDTDVSKEMKINAGGVLTNPHLTPYYTSYRCSLYSVAFFIYIS